MEMIPIEIPAPLHSELARLAIQRGRALEEVIRDILSASLWRDQAALPRQSLLAECYRVMSQDDRADVEGFLPLQEEAMG